LEGFSLFRSIIGRVHLDPKKLKVWEDDNGRFRGSYQCDEKKAKEALLKVLKKRDVPVVSLVLMSPNLRDANANNIQPSHTWVYIVTGKDLSKREGA
jgi:hypothetical protein